MAYVTQYTANFTNELMQQVTVSIDKKNGPSVTPANYRVASLRVSDNSDEQDIYATIISKELELVLWTESTDAITWETFITSAHDDWRITVEVDGFKFFTGFLTPDEGSAPFQDKPYDVVIKASDGLGLLKGYELTDTSGNKFKGFYKFIEYLAGALVKTKLDLPIRIYSNIFHKAMPNKGNSMSNDLFQQVELNARTFLKDVNSYESCYDALKILLSGWCNIQQYNGRWQVVTLAERQYLPGDFYYVDYSYSGTSPAGGYDLEQVALVGKNELIYPINESQRISSNYANKEVKSIFNYQVPEDLVNNQKLQQLGSFLSPLSGASYSAYNLVGWGKYKGDPNGLTAYTGGKNSYIKIEYDAFNTQTDRYYVIESDTTVTTALGHLIRNENLDFFVDAGDKLSISIEARTKFEETGGSNDFLYFGRLAILIDGFSGSSANHWYTLNANGTWVNNPFAVFAQPNETIISTDWNSYAVDNVTIPASGKVFLYLGSGGVNNLNEAHIKEIRIEYVPYIRGARFNVKGDYHINSQTADYPDKNERNFNISDSPKRLVKGSFFWTNASGTRVLLDPDFYRYPNTSETKNFKQLANYGKFNHTYRRFYKIEGDFTSIMYNTPEDQNLRKPLGFHKRYRFTDMNPQREFVLEPSLEMDLVTGNIKATFVEVYKDSNDGQSTGDVDKFDYIF